MSTLASWYDVHVLPRVLDVACGMAVIARQRSRVVPRARGRVLEVGIGTGLNLPFYDPSQVNGIVGVDPAAAMTQVASSRARATAIAIELVVATAEELPLDDESFDCVVCTYTLCTVDRPDRALAEMRRVLRPGGKLLFAEHGLAPDERVARWQSRLAPLWGRLAGGCHLTRDVPQMLTQAGFLVAFESGYIIRPKTLGYNVWGEAMAA